MSGLLGDVLPWLYSQGDRAKRTVNGLLTDPMGVLTREVNNANDRAGGLLSLTSQAAQEPGYGPASKQLAGMLADSYNPAGMAALVKPLGEGAHYGVDSLSEYTPKLYRETSIDRASNFLPNSASQQETLWFSNEPSYALGQGANRGVVMEFNAEGIPGQLSLAKPTARQAYDNGLAEFISRDVYPSEIGKNLQSIRISPDQQKGPYFRRVQGLLKDWSRTQEPDGTVIFSR